MFIYEGNLPDDPAWHANAAFALAVGPLARLWYIESEPMALARFVEALLPRQEAPTS